jgi:hypothetical protein
MAKQRFHARAQRTQRTQRRTCHGWQNKGFTQRRKERKGRKEGLGRDGKIKVSHKGAKFHAKAQRAQRTQSKDLPGMAKSRFHTKARSFTQRRKERKGRKEGLARELG